VRLHALVSDLETARTAVEGGATVLQLRLKDATTAELVERGRPFHAIAREAGVTFIVNDDVAAAGRLGADGVHLGQGDRGVADALAAGLLLGRSAASENEAEEAEREGAAYVGAGPVWGTPTKPQAAPPIGLTGLAAICAAVSVPVIAIGGIDVRNAAACIRAGVEGVAVVRASADAGALREAIDAALADR
jgi:thiamine-phosphate pyrophosphorylase